MHSESNIGMQVVLEDKRTGIIRFIGPTDFKEGIWVGIELDIPLGRNDGQVLGHRYFSCKPGHGLFVHPSKVTLACGGPNIGDILLSTPVKKPLLFPSFVANSKPFNQSSVKKQKQQIEKPSGLDITDSNIQLKLTIEGLKRKLAEREKDMENMKKEYSSLLGKSTIDSTFLIQMKCKIAFSKLKELKRAFMELSEAKSTAEAYYEVEVARLRKLLESKLESNKNCSIEESQFETINYNPCTAEADNMNIYRTWIFDARRKNREAGKSDEVKRLRDIFTRSSTQLGQLSCQNLENVSLSLSSLVNIYSELKRTLCNGTVKR